MKLTTTSKGIHAAAVTVLLLAAVPAVAQYNPPPPLLAPQELDNLVSRIALYPDPLLAQVLSAAAFVNDVPDAARWAYDHRNLRGDELAQTIAESNLAWDPSLQSLLPFPDVLDAMARDQNWTSQLGGAFLAQRDDVMEAVQRMRRAAQNYGYLRTDDRVRVIDDPSYIQIQPYDPATIYVPVYDPYIVYAPPQPGIYIGSAIRFSRGFSIGVGFSRWGWGGGFDWRNHSVIVQGRVHDRDWSNGYHRVAPPTYRRETVEHRPSAPPAPHVDHTYRRDNVRPERSNNAPAREGRGAERSFRR